MDILRRAEKAIWQWPKEKKSVAQPRLVMTLLVKNEEDKLEQNLLFHKAMGVDLFIVTDNNSTDKTMDILRGYEQKGWIAEIIEERATGYEQKQWVDRMIILARDRYKADWVINADADELWYVPSGNLKQEMARCRCRVLRCQVCGMYPEEGLPFWQWTHRVVPVTGAEAASLSPYSAFGAQPKKVAHRTAGYIAISMGNHKVTMLPPTVEDSNIRVYHYNIGTREAFIQKMVQGGRELEQHRGRHGGRHWRYFYQLYKEGRLAEAYDGVTERERYDQLVATGHIVNDTAVADIFRLHHLMD